LQRSGFVVSEACDGSEVADAVQAPAPGCDPDGRPDAGDGRLYRLRLAAGATPEGQEIPVLMITALEDNASIERAFAAGASDYIPKPLHLAVVNQRVRRLVDATRAERHVRHLAYNDPLTGLPNRTLFNDHLNGCIERAGPLQQSLALVVPGPGPFQVCQRHAGSRGGRQVAACAGAADSQLCARQRLCGAPGR
jgi:CheY-like chemotaxis protein